MCIRDSFKVEELQEIIGEIPDVDMSFTPEADLFLSQDSSVLKIGGITRRIAKIAADSGANLRLSSYRAYPKVNEFNTTDEAMIVDVYKRQVLSFGTRSILTVEIEVACRQVERPKLA